MTDTSFIESMYLGLPFVTDLDSGYKGIPHDLINIKIKKYYFQLDQFAYQEYKQGFFTKERFMRYYNHARPDTNLLSKAPLRNYISVLTGIAITDKQKIMIPDLNADHNFSDDPVIFLEDNNRDYHSYQYKGVQFINNKRVFEKTAWVSPGPEITLGYINNGRKIKDTLTPLQVKEDNKSGIFETEGKYYNLIVTKPFSDLFYKEKNIELIYFPEKNRYFSNYPIYTYIRYRSGDSLFIGDYNYLFFNSSV